MSFFYNIILNLMLVLFPYLIYLILKIYVLDNKKEKYYFYLLSIVSIILLMVFSNKNLLELALFIPIPLIFNYIKGNKLFIIFISLILVFINNYYFNISIYLLILEYFIYFLTYIISKRKEQLINIYINRFIIIRSFFLSFYIFSKYYSNDFNVNMIYLIFIVTSYYLISFTFYYLISKKISLTLIDEITVKLENQENIRNYLCAITHELKNSLCITKGYLDMLKKNNKKEEYLKIIRKEINRSIEMIQDGLSVSKDKLNYEILDINILLEDVTDTLEELFKKNKIKYRVEYIDDDIYILGDYEKLKQVLINVLKNSVESKNKNLRIEINSYITKKDVCICIKDNGGGIEDINKLGNGYSNKYNGMGIGTNFSKNIINKHNGKIIYESVKNEGTTVNILLPIFR